MLELSHKCARLEEISISSDIVTSAGMNAVLPLKTLRSLLVYRGDLIDDCVGEGLRRSTDLRELYLIRTSISDAIIPVIGDMESLWSLSLSSTNVTDCGVSSLSKLHSLSRLGLENTRVHGACLSRLPNFERLHLYLDGTPVTEHHLIEYASSHANTELLSLNRCGIGDECLFAISRMPCLSELRLSFTGVTGMGIRLFCGHCALRSLYVEGLEIEQEVLLDVAKASGGRLIIYQ